MSVDWIAYGNKAAHRCLHNAGEWLNKENYFYCVRDLSAAIYWAMEVWLRENGHEPDHRNGWNSQLGQFIQLAPREMMDPFLRLYARVDSWERALAFIEQKGADAVNMNDLDIPSTLRDLHEQTGPLVENLLAAGLD